MEFSQITVEEYTSPIDQVAQAEMTLSEVYHLMKSKDYRHLPVLNENQKLIGILSEREVKLALAIMGDEDQGLKVSDVMRAEPFCVAKNALIEEVAYEMSSRKIGSALVLDDQLENLYGIFTVTDALNALIEIARGDVD